MKWGWKTFFTLADVNMTRMLNTEAPNIKHQGGILVQVCKILIMPLLCMHACTVYCMFVLTLWSLFNVFYHILHIINYNITKASTEKTLFQRGKKKTFSVAWKEAKQRYLHYCIFLRFNTAHSLTIILNNWNKCWWLRQEQRHGFLSPENIKSFLQKMSRVALCSPIGSQVII